MFQLPFMILHWVAVLRSRYEKKERVGYLNGLIWGTYAKKLIEEMLNNIKNFSTGHLQGCSSWVNLACDRQIVPTILFKKNSVS